ncbi:MAG: sigma-54 dependent transcriptional regulator, partial [Eubacteriales bacterium]|nr:sigma-54 dependent transcriptional regulator [Eubacteriales bacterium]
MNYTEKILLVDDDKELLKVFKQIFIINDFNIEAVSNSLEALEIVNSQKVAVVISDIIMPKIGGMELLSKIKEASPSTEVIMLTAEGSVSGAVEAVRRGAFTYMVKPAAIDELLLNVKKAYEIYMVKEENAAFKHQMVEGRLPFVGNNDKIKEIKNKISTIAPSDIIVMLTGESGTGKEIVANAIHYSSNRKDKPFIKVNCAALTESILESELFGHEKGSFTGAEKTYQGRFEMANRGTLLLDEIGELSLNTQGKLLRVLQEKEFERVGSSATIKTDFRLITSTNKNIVEEVEKGNFRQDLFYRINVFPIHLPPLRERKDDIPLLADFLLKQSSMEMNKTIPSFSPEIMEIFNNYDWPGNVRELKNIIERLVVTSKDSKIRIEDIPEEVKTCNVYKEKIEDIEGDSLSDARHRFEKEFILKALK